MFTDCRCLLLAAALMASSTLAPCSFAQNNTEIPPPTPEGCTPLGCTGVAYLQSPTAHWRPTNPSFAVDRRPVLQLHYFNGSYYDNPRGLSAGGNYVHDDAGGPPLFKPDETPLYDSQGNVTDPTYIQTLRTAFSNSLETQLNNAYADGWRRISLYLPSGNPQGQQHFTGSQWWTLPAWKRAAFTTVLSAWTASPSHADAIVGVYIGCGVNDPCALCRGSNSYSTLTHAGCGSYNPPSCSWYYPCDTGVGSFLEDPYNAANMCLLYQNIRPWADIGIREFTFDESSGADHAIPLSEINHSPNYMNSTWQLKFGGEAYPENYAMEDLQKRMPFVITSNYYESHYPTYPPTFNPTNTEMGIIIQVRNYTLNELKTFMTRGNVLWSVGAFDTINVERIKRIYSMGNFNRLDFNGDGVFDGGPNVTPANSQDYVDFLAAYFASHQEGRPYNYAYGDFNDDGIVDPDDLGDFIAAYYSGATTDNHNFGAPDPDGAMP